MTVVFIGAGNLATHLASALQESGHQIIQIFSRTYESASRLGSKLNVPFTNNTSELLQDADIYIYAVSDSALADLAELSVAPEAIHIHTAGSVSMDVFSGKKTNCGVFYPLQTFSKLKDLHFKEIPVFIESSSEMVRDQLIRLARSVSDKVYEITSSQRLNLHIAAVFACNFVNCFYHIASDLVEKADLPFDVLKPLIFETADKIRLLSPGEAQTGPARRMDMDVIDKHLNLLDQDPELRRLYQEVSQMIFNKHV